MKNNIYWLYRDAIVQRVRKVFLIVTMLLISSLITTLVVKADCESDCKKAYDAATEANAETEMDAVEKCGKEIAKKHKDMRYELAEAEMKCKNASRLAKKRSQEDYEKEETRCTEDRDSCEARSNLAFTAAILACQLEPTLGCEAAAYAAWVILLDGCGASYKTCMSRAEEDRTTRNTRIDEDLEKCLSEAKAVEKEKYDKSWEEFYACLDAAEDARKKSDEKAAKAYAKCKEDCDDDDDDDDDGA